MQGSLAGATTLGRHAADAGTQLSLPSMNPVPSAAGRGLHVSMAIHVDGRRRHRNIAYGDDAGDRFWRRGFEERVPRAATFQTLTSESSFMDRLAVAWDTLFPSHRPMSVADIAKTRLRLVLNSDRMTVSPRLKQRLCTHIVNTMAEFVVVNRDEEVQFQVHRSPDTGSVYLVKVPVARVRPQLQLHLQPVVDSMARERGHLEEEGRNGEEEYGEEEEDETLVGRQ